MGTFSGEQLNILFLPFEKESALEEKNLLPANWEQILAFRVDIQSEWAYM